MWHLIFDSKMLLHQKPMNIIQPAKLIAMITQDQFWDDSNWFLHFSAGRLLAEPSNFKNVVFKEKSLTVW